VIVPDVGPQDAERMLAAAWERVGEERSARALRDLALLELVVGVGLGEAEARLLTLTDVRVDNEGTPVAVTLRAGDLDLPFSASVALAEWLRMRADILPAGRMLLLALDDDATLPLRSGDVPMTRAETERVLAAAGDDAGVDVPLDTARPDLTMLGRSPAGWCEDCGGRWYSRTVVEGLQGLNACPRCGGTLHTDLERAEPRRGRPAVAAGEPQFVLGAPRPPGHPHS